MHPPESQPTTGVTNASRSTLSWGIPALLIALALLGIAVWYFGYYDTAAAKCSRGDLGACLVVEASQAASAAPALSAEASASASIAASVAAAQAASAQASASAAASLAAADSARYAAMCSGLGGQLHFGACEIQYTAGDSGGYWWPVPLANDGSWDQAKVAQNQQTCATGQVDGQPAAWHPATKVCAWR
jgi:hypothetical protein